jgi:diguanylate cyclase
MAEVQGTYNLSLVALSYFIAVMASFTALDLSGRVRASIGTASNVWLAGGAFSMGTGIWSMHFVGMLAYQLPMTVGYDIPLTLFSLLTGIVASGIALAIVNTGSLSHYRLGFGGLAMGAGICLMHYSGMAAMKMEPPVSYDTVLFITSIVVAITASLTALWLAFRLNPDRKTALSTSISTRLLAAAVMGVAIAGMHYIGMEAMQMPLMSHSLVEAAGIKEEQLAIAIAIMAVCIMSIALVLSVYEAHLSTETARLAKSLQEANDELHALAMHDSLTRLPNRLLLEDRIEQIMARARRKSLRFALLFIDLDRFKTINDTLGHHVGDVLLQQLARRLSASMRDADTIARVGGDEFMAVLGEDSDREVATQVAKRMMDSVCEVFRIGHHEIQVSLSIGISLFPQDSVDIHELIVRADAAMYSAKASGKNNVQFFEQGISYGVEHYRKLEKKLAEAIENESLTIVYQPKVDVFSKDIVGVEALVGWHDDELGNIAPSELISVAEDSGLILALGEWVFRSACLQTKAWQELGFPEMEMAVNISTAQLNHAGFLSMIKKVLSETNMRVSCLELQLTESAVMQNVEMIQQCLNKIHAMGIKVTIGDFGTGYTNLLQLKKFPIDRLKIDRSFTAGLPSSAQDVAIVQAIIALARSFNLEVIAEGIETEQQLEFVRGLKVKQYYGYLCCKPVLADDMTQFIEHNFLPKQKSTAIK